VISDFGDFVSRPADFHGILFDDGSQGLLKLDEPRSGIAVRLLFCGAASEVGLVFFALGVGEVGAFVGVEG
jgi:hypothetical protein